MTDDAELIADLRAVRIETNAGNGEGPDPLCLAAAARIEALAKAEKDCEHWAADYAEQSKSLLAWKARAEAAEAERDALKAELAEAREALYGGVDL